MRARHDHEALPASASFQRRLVRFNRTRLRPGRPSARWEEELDEACELARLEGRWIEHERAAIASAVAEVPREPAAFLRWFEALAKTGPGQGDPLFPWLAEESSLEQMRWFLTQEVAGEAGFDDLVALSQLKLPPRPKLELARNYWDEMGNGREVGMHGPMLGHLSRSLALPDDLDPIVPEALAVGNLLTALAMNRRYAFLSLGALGAVELTAPTRAVHVARGLERLGLSSDQRRYYAVHAVLDVKHAEAWNREVIVPLVEEDPSVAPLLAEGALLRLEAGARSFARYRRELWGAHAPGLRA